MRSPWMTSEQAAAALGVRLPTLYAYVSRGVIPRDVVTDPRGQRVSRFRRDDVLTLARARSRPRAGAWAPLIESDVTWLDASGRLAFRGVDVADCAAWGFERTARHVLDAPDTGGRTASGPRLPDVAGQGGAEVRPPGAAGHAGAEVRPSGTAGRRGVEHPAAGAGRRMGTEARSPGAAERAGAEIQPPGTAGRTGSGAPATGAGRRMDTEARSPGTARRAGAEASTPGADRRMDTEARPPGAGRAGDTIRLTVMRLAAQDAFRERLDPGHCREVALAAVEAATVALTGLHDGTVAERLTRAWTPDAPESARGSAVVRAVDTALSVLVDHELTASTLAARAAAGVRADPWMVLLTGLAAMSGPSQAGAARAAAAVLRAWDADRTVPTAPAPGFGHAVYTGPDPRAVLLLDRVAAVCPGTADSIDALAVRMARAHGLHPNVDAALGGLIVAADLPDDAGEAVFALARVPGLMAHALEEYPHGLRLRPRALS